MLVNDKQLTMHKNGTMASASSSPHGQDHDRLKAPEDAFAGETMISSRDGMNTTNTDGSDITATQKMASAITGSLLTSLLGMFCLGCIFLSSNPSKHAANADLECSSHPS